MIIDLAKLDAVGQQHSSACIAGAGAAGICLAVELARLGVDVTILESGGLEEEQATQDLYASEVLGIPHRGIHEGRFRVLGGTTTHWRGQILELDSSDLDHRPWVPNSGWPFPKQSLIRYYRRALELEGLASVICDDTSVWKAIDCPPPNFGDELEPFFSRWCPEPNFARLYGNALRESGKITVYLHANLSEIVLTPGHQGIAGFKCRTLSGRSFTFTAAHYIFCLGGIETARILLQPLAGAHTAPWNTFGLVGRYFQDHIEATLLEVRPRNRRQLHQWFDNVYRCTLKYHPKLKLSACAQQRLECLAISASFSFNNPKTEALEYFSRVAGQIRRGNIQAIDFSRIFQYLPHAGFLLRKAASFRIRGRGYIPSSSGVFFLRFHCEQTPNPESRIEITAERDPIDLFKTSLNWRTTDQEIHTMQQFARVIANAFQRTGFAHVIANPALQTGGPGLINLFEDTFHHMGATRMADSPKGGVVDANLRLFGVHNGYVCSSSVFPTSGFSNPTHTIIALATRLAEHLTSTSL